MLSSLHQGAFPARLKKVLIVGAPVWFRVPYNLLSLLLKEKLRERVNGGACCSFSNTCSIFLMILTYFDDEKFCFVCLGWYTISEQAIAASDHLIRGFSLTTNP